MTSFLSLIGLALLLFASTNMDDIFILVGFFADRRYSSRDVVVGQFGGIAVLFGVSLAGALLQSQFRNLTLASSGSYPSSSVVEVYGILFTGWMNRKTHPNITLAERLGERPYPLHSSPSQVARTI